MIGGASDSREAKLLAFLQDLDGEFAADRGKAFQEFIERIAVLDVVEKSLHGDAGPAEYRCPMHHFGVACDGILHDSNVAQHGSMARGWSGAKRTRLPTFAVGEVRVLFDADEREGALEMCGTSRKFD
jgi:hypothetical protein